MRPAANGQGVKVLYIVGFPRSGSTLLERLLGSQAGTFSAGELRRIWERGFLANELCSCGVPFRSCPFWTEVVEEAFGGLAQVDAEALAGSIAALGDRRVRWPQIARRLLPSTGTATRSLDRVLLALYRAIVAVSGAPALVDSSKDSTYALLLSRVAGIEVEIIHLVRDSRAVAYSWQRRRRRPEVIERDEFMPLVRPSGTALGWSQRNGSAEALRWVSERYVRLRYEDLAADPQAELARLLEWTRKPGDAALEARSAPASYHTVSGNPLRLRKAPLEVTPDVEWMTAMEGRDRATVTALTLPLLLRYGYELGPAPFPGVATAR